MTLLFTALLSGGLLLLQSGAPAQSGASLTEPTTVAPVETRGTRRICVSQRSRVQVGSRIRDPAARTVCKTRQEWAADVEANKEDMQKIFADVPRILGAEPTAGEAPNCANQRVC